MGGAEQEHEPSATLVQKVQGRLAIIEERCFFCEYSVAQDDEEEEYGVPCQFSFVASLQEKMPVYHENAKKPLLLLNDEVSLVRVSWPLERRHCSSPSLPSHADTLTP